MSLVSNVTNSSTYTDAVTKAKGDSLGKEDFLKLLVAQLTYQDPTNPMKDTEFVSQLATYSGLEQQMAMNKNLEKLISFNAASVATSAVGLIGKVVSYIGEDGGFQTGQVMFVDINAGDVYLYLNDGTSEGAYIPFDVVEQIGLPIESETSDVSDEQGSD
ncbi:MAG: flagellar hook assembly protein FlgD [Synergistaceae bacterium]|jgi:flagellar basal-body rod modification protein FlgD|nr:flagellar hook assembly protein FlgD [Synergistaceae bacterium]